MKGQSTKRAQKALKSAQRALESLSQAISGLERTAKLALARKGEIVVTGIGKSGYIGQKIAATLTSLGHRSVFLHPSEALHGDIGVLSNGDVLLALSYSGESKEVVKLVEYAKKNFAVSVVAFTKSKRSSLGNLSDETVEIKVVDEGSPENLAPMASTTAMLVLGDMFASMLTGSSFRNHFAKAHPGGSLGLEMTLVHSIMKKGKGLPLVAVESSASSSLKEMTKKALGITGVVNAAGKLVGIITDGDVRRWLLRSGNPASDAAKDIMTRAPKTISSKATLKDALSLMEKYKITTLFAVENGKPVGIIHIHDIVGGSIIR